MRSRLSAVASQGPISSAALARPCAMCLSAETTSSKDEAKSSPLRSCTLCKLLHGPADVPLNDVAAERVLSADRGAQSARQHDLPPLVPHHHLGVAIQPVAHPAERLARRTQTTRAGGDGGRSPTSSAWNRGACERIRAAQRQRWRPPPSPPERPPMTAEIATPSTTI